jgi:hypothetical protein
MNFPSSKIILIVTVTIFAFFQSTISHGQMMGSDLKGQWAGSGLLYAKGDGFSPSKDSIKMHISQQEDLTFKGRIERSYRGKMILQDIEGYIDKNMHNICFVDQKNKNVIIGYVASNAIMKLYSWDNHESKEVTVYLLRKTVTAPN